MKLEKYIKFVAKQQSEYKVKSNLRLLRSVVGLVCEIQEYKDDPCISELSDIYFWLIEFRINFTYDPTYFRSNETIIDNPILLLDCIEKYTRAPSIRRNVQKLKDMKLICEYIRGIDIFVSKQLNLLGVTAFEIRQYNYRKLTTRNQQRGNK